MDTAIEQKKLSGEGILFNKKVILMPVPRAGAMIAEKKHIGYFMYDGTKAEFVVPLSAQKGGIIPILTRDEQAFFEQELREDLNVNKKVGNFWNTFRVSVIKDNNFMEKGIEYDLSDVMDNLRWRVLKAQPTIAPSWDERYDSGEYRFALCEAGYQDNHKINKQEKMKLAYKLLGKIDTTSAKLYDFLCVYWMHVPKSKRPDPNAAKDIYASMVQDIIDNEPDLFIKIASDKQFATKLFINRGLQAGFIDKVGLKGDYTVDGRFLGRTIDDAAMNLMTPEWREDHMRIKAMLDSNKTAATTIATEPTESTEVE